MLLIRYKCTTVQLRGKKMLLKIGMYYSDVSDEFKCLFCVWLCMFYAGVGNRPP